MRQNGGTPPSRGDTVSTSRHMLVVAHLKRDDAIEAAKTVATSLHRSGIGVVIAGDQPELADLLPVDVSVLGQDVKPDDVELGISLGGDGTLLYAAELLRGSTAPLFGVNLGHVGFLAESEKDDLDHAIARAIASDYEVESRMAIDVVVKSGESDVFRTWALNEAAIEKASPKKMIEVAVAVDNEPVSTFGCDGVVLATPTGSTAYSFSAGGPIVWPGVEALLMVPLAAHALFSRPLVTGPDSLLSVLVLERSGSSAVLSCDGRREVYVEPGMRVEVSRSEHPVRLARLHPGPFTTRLVRKFQLPVTGWRTTGLPGGG
jgi:NAD+ kinase